MKSNKILMILSSLVILMMCLSVVSAAVDDVDNEITIVNDAKSPSHISIEFGQNPGDLFVHLEDDKGNGIANAKVNFVLENDNGTVDEGVLTTDENGMAVYNYGELAPGKYTFKATFEGNEVYNGSNGSFNFNILIPTKFTVDTAQSGNYVAKLTADNGDVLANTPVIVTLTDANGKIIKEVPMTTDANGEVEFVSGKLPEGKYFVTFSFEGDDVYNYCDSKEMPLEFWSSDSNPDDVDMKNTGLPIVALVLGLLAVAGVGYKRY